MVLWAIAARNLTRHRRRTAVTLLALSLGLALVTVARGFTNAQHALMIDGAVNADSGALMVHRRGHAQAVTQSPLRFTLEDTPELRRKLLMVEGVRGVAPRLRFAAQLSNPESARHAPGASAWLSVTAIDPLVEDVVTPRRKTLFRSGTPLAQRGPGAFALSASLAGALQPPFGERTPDAERPALLVNDADGAPNGELVAPVGTFEPALPGDRKVALMQLEQAQRLLRLEGRVTEYGIAVNDFAAVATVREALQRELGPGYDVLAWSDQHPLLAELHRTQDRVFAGLSALFLLVVLFGAVNQLLMGVLERVREIGTLVALGLTRRQVATMFVFEGVALAVVGAALGLGAGYAGAALLNAVGIDYTLAGTQTAVRLDFQPGLRWVLASAALVIGCSAIASLWPARAAARLHPADALRGAS
jgi:putative ABC transport system permease protein